MKKLILMFGIVIVLLISGCNSIGQQVHPCEQPYTLNLSCQDAQTCAFSKTNDEINFPTSVYYYEEKCKLK